ncbi:MAG TPA: pyrroline-5-carboxylate reductase [Polyangiaceae bacterium]|jgi:pyrroline-5-carboxylate reductase|nr:pyrroline-5-carboxylate reductase [Polyangiaceae bacterium]
METRCIGFIGGGNMASALIAGLIDKGTVAREQIRASDVSSAQLQVLTNRFGIETTTDNAALVDWADCVILAVKPQTVAQALGPCATKFGQTKLLISVCAGVSIEGLAERVGKDTRIVRAMPNTPALIGEGATAFAMGPSATVADQAFASELFGLVGKALVVAETQLDAVTGLSGSGPAYALLFMEALADGGVRMGLSRDVARELAIQTLLGTARLAAQGDAHLAELRDRVTSPAGTTAEGLFALERGGVRAALVDAVAQATLRSRELGARGPK